MTEQPKPRPKGSQLTHREDQLREAVARHEAAAAEPERTEEELNAAGEDWLRGELVRMRERRLTVRRREPEG